MLNGRNKSESLTIFVFKGKRKVQYSKACCSPLPLRCHNRNAQVQNKERTEKYTKDNQRAIVSFIQNSQIFDTEELQRIFTKLPTINFPLRKGP
jgi:hypothetical protein